jgi:hypothetical protein
MEMLLLAVILFFVLIVLALQFRPSKRGPVDLTSFTGKLDSLQSSHERTDRSIRDEISKFHEEMKIGAHQERAELARSLRSFGDSVEQKMEALLPVSVALIVHSFGNI